MYIYANAIEIQFITYPVRFLEVRYCVF